METLEKTRLRKEIMQKIGLSTKEEAVAKGISDLSDTEKLEMMTNLAAGEDDELSLMSNIADRYDLPWLKTYVSKKLTLRMSVNGWKANQIVAVATEKIKEERKGILGRIFNRDAKKDRWKVEEFE